MPKITGQLTDFGLDAMLGKDPIISFRFVSEGRPTSGIAAANVLANREVLVRPEYNGYFEGTLTSTEKISPAGYYLVSVHWRDELRQRRSEQLPWRLYVPPAGGALADLLRVPSNPALVFTGPKAPANPSPGSWWLNPESAELLEYGRDGWTYKANLRGVPGYAATGAAEDMQALARYVRQEAGANPFGAALREVIAGDVLAEAAPIRALQLRAAQFDDQGRATLATLSAAARARYEDTAEMVEDWQDLAGTAGSNGVIAADGLLTTPEYAPAPTAAKLAWKPGSYGIARAILNYVPGDTAAFFGVAGTTKAPLPSSSDALMVGIRAAGTPGRVRGTDVGGTGQADFDPDPLPAGRYLATVAVTPGNISLTLKSLATLQEWGRNHPRSDMDPVGGIAHILLYAGWRSGGGQSAWEPVTYSAELTTGKARTVSGRTVRGEAPSVHYLGPADRSDNWRVQLPAKHDPRIPTPLVLWLHNNSGTATNGAIDPRMKPLMDALSGAGYLVASADADGSAWANDGSRKKYVALFEYMRTRYAVSSVILLGVSMGGQVALNLLPRQEIPNVSAYVGVGAVASLDNLWTSYASSIRPAFGIAADGSNYEAKTAGYRPEDRPGSDFRGIPMMLVHSAGDKTCSIESARELAAKVAPYAPEASVIESTGEHLAAAQFTDAIKHAIPFMRRYAPTP